VDQVVAEGGGGGGGDGSVDLDWGGDRQARTGGGPAGRRPGVAMDLAGFPGTLAGRDFTELAQAI
jgi:hypothetical protein